MKELLRKSALSALAGHSEVVRPEHVEEALGELAAGGRLAERLVGFRPENDSEPPRQSGFPTLGLGAVISQPE